MKLKTGILTIFLILGLLGVPSGVFAQESPDLECVSDFGVQFLTQTTDLNPEVKVSSSDYDDDFDDDTSDDWLAIPVLIGIFVFFGIIVAVALYAERKKKNKLKEEFVDLEELGFKLKK